MGSSPEQLFRDAFSASGRMAMDSGMAQAQNRMLDQARLPSSEEINANFDMLREDLTGLLSQISPSETPLSDLLIDPRWRPDIGRLESDDDIKIIFEKDPYIIGTRITATHPSGLRKAIMITDMIQEGARLPASIVFMVNKLKEDIRMELDKPDPNFKPLPLKDILKGLKKEKPENIKEKVLNTIKKPLDDYKLVHARDMSFMTAGMSANLFSA